MTTPRLNVVITANTSGLNRALAQAEAATRRASANMARSLRNMGSSVRRTGASMAVNLTAPILGFGATVAATSGGFQKQMNRIAAITGATGVEFDNLKAKARELGSSTQYTAAQAADAMGFLAMAGQNVSTILVSIGPSLTLAATAGMDLASATDIVTNVLTGFRMSSDELAPAVNVLARGLTGANTDLLQLGEAFKYAGPIAKAAGMSFTETAATLASMGNSGIQASMAGTSLRGAITKLLSPTKAAQKEMQRLGLSATDADGRLRPMTDIIRQLEPHANDAAAMMTIFGLRAGPAFAGLIGQGADAIAALDAEMLKAAKNNYAQQIADVQMQGLVGAFNRLKAAFEGSMLDIGESGVNDQMIAAMDGLTGFLNSLSEIDPAIIKFTANIAAMAAAVGPLLIVLGTLVATLGALLSPLGLLTLAVGGAGLALAFDQMTGAAREARRAYADLYKLMQDAEFTARKGIDNTREATEAKLKEVAVIQMRMKLRLEEARAELAAQTARRDQLQNRNPLTRARDMAMGVATGGRFSPPEVSGRHSVGAAQKVVEDLETQITRTDESLKSLLESLAKGFEPVNPTAGEDAVNNMLDGFDDGLGGFDFEQKIEGWREKLARARGEADQVARATRDEIAANLSLARSAGYGENILGLERAKLELMQMAQAMPEAQAAQLAAELVASEQTLERSVNLMRDMRARLEEAARAVGDAFTYALEQAITRANSFGDILKALAADLIMITLRTAVLQPMSQAITASVGSFLGLPGRALGGPVQGGQPYMVGERGPEIVIPSASGRVANHLETMRMMGGNGAVASVSVSIDARGAGPREVDALRAELARLEQSLPARVVQATAEARRRGTRAF